MKEIAIAIALALATNVALATDPVQSGKAAAVMDIEKMVLVTDGPTDHSAIAAHYVSEAEALEAKLKCICASRISMPSRPTYPVKEAGSPCANIT